MCLTVGYARSDSGIIITETAGIILETGDYTFIVPPTLYPQNCENGENRLQLKTVYATCYLGLLLKSVETAAPRIRVRYTYRGRNREMLGLFGPAFVIDFWIQLLSQTSVICAVRFSEKFFLLIPDCRGLQSHSTYRTQLLGPNPQVWWVLRQTLSRRMRIAKYFHLCNSRCNKQFLVPPFRS